MTHVQRRLNSQHKFILFCWRNEHLLYNYFHFYYYNHYGVTRLHFTSAQVLCCVHFQEEEFRNTKFLNPKITYPK
jgi:hypothetical protein